VTHRHYREAIVTRILGLLIVAVLAASVSQEVLRSSAWRCSRRSQGGGINWAPAPGVFTVVSVDSYSRQVRLRSNDGKTGDVFVGEDIYDLSKLKTGDKVQVDFVIPDSMNPKLSAATIWPVP
jgi:hypothetical protein